MKLTSLSSLSEYIAGMNYYWGGVWPPWFLLPFMGKDSLLVVLSCMVTYADIDKKRFFGNDNTNKGISGTKPHPRPSSNTFL